MKRNLLFLICVFLLTAGTNAQNKNDSIYANCEVIPTFTGGDAARMKFLMKNLKYPKDARENGIEGTVYVEFVVEKNGSLTNINIKRGIGGGCDQESVRVVKLMPKWRPGMQNSKPVKTKFVMPIKFILN